MERRNKQLMEITPEYQLMEFLQDFSYQDEQMNTIKFAEEAQNTFNESVKKSKIFNKPASFKIKIEIKPMQGKQSHMCISADITDKSMPKASIEPAAIFIDQRCKLHKHGDPKQLRIDDTPKVTELKGKEKA